MKQITTKQISDVSTVSYWILIIITCIPFIGYATGFTEFLSSPVSIIASFILIAALFLLNMEEISRKTRMEPLIALVGFLAISGLYFHAWGCVVNCANTILLMIVLNNIELKKNQKKNLHLWITILLLIFLLSLRIEPLYKTYQVFAKDELELNLNTLGLLVLICYFHFWLFIEKSNFYQLAKELFVLGGVFVTVYYIRLSSCRSAMMALVLFGVFWLSRKWEMKNYRKWVVRLVIFAMLCPFVYMQFSDALSALEIGDKSLGSRVMVWESAWEIIQKSPILGTGTEENMMSTAATLTASAHNVFLGFWKTVGIVPTLMVAYYLCTGRNVEHVTTENRLSKKMFLACMIICAFETLLNDSNTYIFFVMLLLTGVDETEEQV